jgi:hypothetical protein
VVIAFGQPLLKSPLSCGQGRRGATNTVAPRLLQFLGSLLKVFVNRTPDEFGNRSACPVGKNQQFLELVFLQEEGRSFHVHIIAYRHTYGNNIPLECISVLRVSGLCVYQKLSHIIRG